MTIRTLIVDDEPLARRGIRQLLAEFPGFSVEGECRDGREALRALAQHPPDLVFLDIEMPGIDGLSVIRTHGVERMPLTVFVTAHHRFAVDAFEAAALDYLVKPVTRARFRRAIQRILERRRLSNAVSLSRQLRTLLEVYAPGVDPTAPTTEGRPAGVLLVRTPTGEQQVETAHIDWIGREGHHVVVHSGRARWIARESLDALERRLDARRFARIHRTAIVRVDRIQEWRGRRPGRDAAVVLRDGTVLPLSRRRMQTLKTLFRRPPPPPP